MILKELNYFIHKERIRLETRDNNKFSITFSEISKYLEYLYIIFEEHNQYSSDFITNTKLLQNTFTEKVGKVTPEQNEIMQKGREITTHLHLGIESYFLFAKILLDKVALAFEFYFGQERALPLTSHDKLNKNIEQYVDKKGVLISSNLLEDIKKLKTDISDFRDYQIQHLTAEKRSRIMRGTSYDSEGNTTLSISTLYPKDGERQSNSRKIKELMPEIEDYIKKVIETIEKNREKCGLKLEDEETVEAMEKVFGIADDK